METEGQTTRKEVWMRCKASCRHENNRPGQKWRLYASLYVSRIPIVRLQDVYWNYHDGLESTKGGKPMGPD